MAVYTFEYRITPARLDMLIAIARDPTGIPQKELSLVLDCCGAVVSRMLDSLEHLGYVARHQDERDWRANMIGLTPLGRSIFDEIIEQMLVDGFTEHMVREVLSSDSANEAYTVRLLARTRRFLAFLRQRVIDRSTLLYPCYLADGDRSPEHPYRRGDHVLFTRRRRRHPTGSATTP